MISWRDWKWSRDCTAWWSPLQESWVGTKWAGRHPGLPRGAWRNTVKYWTVIAKREAKQEMTKARLGWKKG